MLTILNIVRIVVGKLNLVRCNMKTYTIKQPVFEVHEANEWKSQIDDRAYEALMNYEVNIDD